MKKLILMVAVAAAAVGALAYSSKVSAAPAEAKLTVTDEMVDAKIDARLHDLLARHLANRGALRLAR